MESYEKLYGRDATHFTLRCVLAPSTTMDGRLVLELADLFANRLLFPGSPLTSLWTKAPGIDARPAIGEFADRKWAAARRKVESNQCAMLRLEARTTDFPDQWISLNVHANPPGGGEHLDAGTVDVTCSLPYLRHLAASKEKVEALIDLGRRVWQGAAPAYGFGNVAARPKRAGIGSFALGGPPKLGPAAPPARSGHDIPVAQTGNDIDGNIDVLIVNGGGIKGAYWANFLAANHVRMAGGADRLNAALPGMRLEPLAGDGLLVVATETPLPEDSEEHRASFRRLAAALQPAFLSREQTPENKRALLGEFYREKS